MSDLRKLAEQAMGYLADYTVGESPNASAVNDLIADLDAALAQPEPESVLHKWAALFEDPNNDWQAGYEHARRWVLEVGLQSIATPPQRKPLTEEEIAQIDWKDGETLHDFARAIERAHGIGGES